MTAYVALGRHPYGQGRPEAIAFRVVHEGSELEGLPPSLAPAVAAARRPRTEDRVSLPALVALLGDPDPDRWQHPPGVRCAWSLLPR